MPCQEESCSGCHVKNYSPGYMEQAPSRGEEASPQSGLGVGCKLCSSSEKLGGLGLRAQTRRISIFPLLSVLGVSSLFASAVPCVLCGQAVSENDAA